MSRVAFVNGRYVPQAQASVNVEDRGFQLADGVYEVVYLDHGRFIDEDRHLDRLERSLREIRLTFPLSRPALRLILRELARRNRIATGLLYLQVTRGVARREHAFPTKPVPPTLVATIRRLPAFPADAAAWQVNAITFPDQRWERCDIKNTGLLANVLARQAAKERGAYEAILIDRNGMVTEGAATTVWIVDEAGVLRTRQLDHAVLPGCTRAAVIDLLRDAGVSFEEGAFSEQSLRAAREAFLTSATSFVKPVVRLDGAPVGKGGIGPVSRDLLSLMRRHVS